MKEELPPLEYEPTPLELEIAEHRMKQIGRKLAKVNAADQERELLKSQPRPLTGFGFTGGRGNNDGQ